MSSVSVGGRYKKSSSTGDGSNMIFSNIMSVATTWYDIPNLSISLNTKGSAVEIRMQPDGSTAAAYMYTESTIEVRILRDGSEVARHMIFAPSTTDNSPISLNMFTYIDTNATEGTHAYKYQIRYTSGFVIGRMGNVLMLAREL